MISNIKKLTLSVSVIVLFALYSLQRREMLPGQTQTTTALVIPTAKPSTQISAQVDTVATTTASDPPAVANTTEPTVAAADQKSTDVFGKQSSSAIEGPTETPTPQATASTGQYVDGTYTGPPADANWGDVQVEVIVVNGQIDSVQVLEFPDHRSRSRSINERAVPELIQEAVQAQSADVDIVSGATDTSEGFINSLDSALQEATR